MSQPQKRGRLFNYFIGLLFQQLPDVDVIVGEHAATGEIDVFVSCIGAPDWVTRLVGSATMIENKWEAEPIETSEVESFHSKTEYVPVRCELCYFISMSGFSSDSGLSAEQVIMGLDEPSMIGIGADGVRQMVDDGTPEQLMKNRMLK